MRRGTSFSVAAMAAGIALGATLVLMGPWFSNEPAQASGSPVWWFDTARGTVCWLEKGPSPTEWDLIVDLDGNHATGLSSYFSWTSPVGNYAAPFTWEGGGGSTIINESGTGLSLISESVVSPPWPHVQFPIRGGVISEWFHPFVTKRTPPTDWVLGLSDDNGHQALRISRPFWVGLDRGKTWTEYDPAAFTGPTGECVEDLPGGGAISATIDFDPDVVNPRSAGNWVTIYIELPAGYDPRDINATTIRLNDTLPPVLDSKYGFATDPAGYIVDHDGDGILERMVKFDRTAVIGLLPPGTYSVKITGRLFPGVPFEGVSDPVRVIGFPG